MNQPLHERIAAAVLDYVSRPPRGDDPVIEWRPPEELEAIFADSVGLNLVPGEPAHADDAVLAAVHDVIRYSVHTSHPRFINQNFAGPSKIAVVGDWLGAALNTTNATFEAAPVFTLMERAVLRRLALIAGFEVDPDGIAPGMFTPGGSTATLYALHLARHRHDPECVTLGTRNPYALFVSASGHYSTRKSAALLGMGTESVVVVDADEEGAMRPQALAAAISDASAAGRVPLAVVATAGTTVTSAFDPIHPIADLCDAHGLWLHVDGAWGGSALMSDRHRHLLDGVERADSMLWNLHKMLGITQQCSTLLLRDPSQLAPCFAARADYLFQPDKLYAELDNGDRTFQCARRVDVLKAWLAWKTVGDRGFAARIDHAVELADHARARIADRHDLAMVVEGRFTNVCFTSGADPAPIKARMQREGTAMVGFQPVNGVNCFRLIFTNPEVSREDVDTLIDLIAPTSDP